jgi:phospholipid transport system substrate-binding protein
MTAWPGARVPGLPCRGVQPILGANMHILSFIVLLALSAGVLAETSRSPDDTVRGTVQSLAALVSDCRLPLAADPVALRGVVEQHLRPRADVLYAGQVVLGRHWSNASPEQRRRFAEALYGTLLSRYASGLLLLTDRNVVVVPSRAPPANGEAEVELRIQGGLGAPIPVFLQMRRSGELWRVHDARWEGQSFALSLRQAFSEQIRQEGLDAVITRLQASAGPMVGLPEERQTAAGRCLRARMTR